MIICGLHIPEMNSFWINNSGDKIKVLMIADKNKVWPLIVYEDKEGEVLTINLSTFHRRFRHYEAAKVQRDIKWLGGSISRWFKKNGKRI